MYIGPKKYFIEMVVEADGERSLADSEDVGFSVKRMVKAKFDEVAFAHIAVIADDKKPHWRRDPLEQIVCKFIDFCTAVG